MKRTLTLICSFILGLLELMAQNVVYGNVKDSLGNPLNDVIVSVITERDSAVIAYTYTAGGEFLLRYSPSAADTCQLKIHGFGFEKLIFNIPKDSTAYDAGDIRLIQTYNSIEASYVVIETEYAIQSTQGKTIYSIPQIMSENSIDLYALLQKIPDIIIEGDDVKVLGKGNSAFTINGRPLRPNELKSLSPKDVLKISIDRMPSSKYSTSVKSVIDIKTKHSSSDRIRLLNDFRFNNEPQNTRGSIMPHNRDINYHSEPVQEIMGTLPSWITRWGVTVIFAVFTLIVIGCCIVRYPQTVDAGISITSSCPPSELTARYDGLIDMVCIIDGQKVQAGELIALLSTPARYEDVISMSAYLSLSDTLGLDGMAQMPVLSADLQLGGLQGQWSTLQKAFRDYSHYLETNQIAVRKGLLRQQIEGQKSHHATLLRQKALLDSEVEMERATLERDSLLYARKAISQAEYETSRKGFLAKMNTVAGFEASLEATALGILQLEQQLVELDLQRVTETETHESQISQQIYHLKAQVATWLDTYAIIAPSEGIVSLQDYWSPGQHVNVGDVIANITPEDPSEVTGRMKVPSAGFGKVALGQTVNVRLNGFPYMEYGILKGVVANVASVPERLQDGSVAYTVAVDFPDGLESTYHKEFPLIQQMDGDAQIITRDRRLIEQFIDPIVSLFRNR